jgi:uncharacterized repeat protein (TIGR01451 family)
MDILGITKNRIVWLVLILFISLGLVGVALAAAGHMGGSITDIQSIYPQTPSEGQLAGLLPPSPVQIVSNPSEITSLGDQIGEQMRQQAMADSRFSHSSSQSRIHSGALAEIQRVEFWMMPSGLTGIWGGADPNQPITITISTGETLYAFSDEFGEYSADHQIFLSPGDIITATAGTGGGPVIVVFAELMANSDSAVDQVIGHISYPAWEVEIYPWWGDEMITTTTDMDGDFAETFDDIPPQGRGYIRFQDFIDPNNAMIVFHKPFYDLQPAIRANYAHDWVEGNYDPGYQVSITVTDSPGDIKGTAQVETFDPGWNGETGFATWYDMPWDGIQPDVQVGDYVYLSIDNGRSAMVQLGEIDGSLDSNTDVFEGSLNIPWLTDPVHVDCGVWVEYGPGMGFDDIDPQGGTFTCDFASLGWDLLPGMDVGVSYNDPDANQVINVFREPAPELRIDMWGQGVPASGNNYIIEIHYNNNGWAPAPDVTIQAAFWGMVYLSDTSGLFHTGTGDPADPLIWDVGVLPFSHSTEQSFYVFVQVVNPPGGDVFTSADIATPLAYYQGDEGRKHANWESGIAEVNDSELNIGKWAWTWAPVPGQEFVYAVNTCNNGSTSSSELYITDTLPLSTTLMYWWGQEPGWEEISSSDHELVVKRPTVTGGKCTEIYLDVLLSDQAYPGMNLHNEAWVWAESDNDPENNFTSMDHPVGKPEYNLHLGANWVQGQFIPGGTVSLEINYANWGNMPMSGTVLTATIPAGTEFQFAYTLDWSGWIPFTPTIITDEYLVWDIGDYPNGYNRGLGVQFRIDDSTLSGTSLDVEYRIMGDILEVRYDDNTVVYHEIVNDNGSNLRVDKHTNWEWNSWDNSARQLWYELRILNIGTEYLENVVITDTYPLSTTVSGCGWNHGPGDLQPCEVDEANHLVIFRLDYMNPGDTASANLRVDLASEDAGVQGLLFTNQVDISDYSDIDPSDNHDELMSYSGPDVFVRKWLKAGELCPGGLITYTVEFGNQNRWPWNWDWPYGSHITETCRKGRPL